MSSQSDPHSSSEALPRIGIDARKLGDFGIGEHLWHLIREFARQDQGSQYVILHQGGERPPGSERFRWVRNDSPKYSLREQISLPWQAWREKLDMLHVPHYAAPLWTPCPMVVSVHDLIHLRFPRNLPHAAARAYARFMMMRAVASARAVITVSNHSRDDLVTLLGVPSERITVVYNGIPHDARAVTEPAALEDMRLLLGWDGPFLLTVANPRMRHKNLPLLMQSFARILERSAPELRLVIAGGDPPSELRAAVQAALGPRSAQVLFPGYLTRASLLALYSAAEAFLWPSLYEGFGMPPLEAMACGTPVISSNSSAMPEVLGDGARYADPTSAEAFAEAVIAVLGSTSEQEDLVRRGRKQAARYTWARAASQTLEVYRAVLDG